ncbi:Coatomer subunit beta-1 [Dichanthelium oligosanthes]|uniref:Coatomer subunit beta-1 n=1 Tax=Dichanthelium oligosanthes TaxID=888268 RepID=A0A1E5UUN5_9POAL|nr:Coatomer subunit beta-1 [Dichanthelium oligosanthes]
MEKPCTFLVHFNNGTPSMVSEIIPGLVSGSGNDAAKAGAMKRAISVLLNGEPVPRLLTTTVVRYVFPCEDHTVQKLVLLYLEAIDKRDAATGKVLPETIHIISGIVRSNLEHPNEYIRGVTLRFLCRLSGEFEPALLEPLVPCVLANLQHRHPFVRRHALSAASAICRLPHEDHLIPNAPELALRALAAEQDAAARRNAFLMLCDSARDRAVAFLVANAKRVTEWPDLLQMAALGFVRKVCLSSQNHHADRGRCARIIASLLSAPSAAVVYECARALVFVSLSSSTLTSLHVAALTYCELLCWPTDDNVKLIVLDRLHELCATHREVMEDKVMDVLRAVLDTANLDVRMKMLGLVLDLVTPGNVEEVVLHLKEEVEEGGEHRQMLLQAIHACALKYPEQGVPPSFGTCLCPWCPLAVRTTVPATWLAPAPVHTVLPRHGRRRRRRRG